jgi:hypothetical protein
VVPTHYVATSITHLVPVEVIEGLVSTVWMWTSVAVMWIEAAINVATEVASTVKPRAGPDEHAAIELLGPVVPVWGAVVWSEIVLAVWAYRFCSDSYGDLGGCRARHVYQSGNQARNDKRLPIAHVFLLIPKKNKPDAKGVMTERDSHPRQGNGGCRTHVYDGPLSRSDQWPTKCRNKDTRFRGTQIYQRDLSAIVDVLFFLNSITCRDPLPCASLAFLVHILG